LIWERGAVTIEPYWQLDFAHKIPISAGEAVEALRAWLAEATRPRLVSDVPLGALLSGGVDSSAVVALMSQAMDRPVKTFSVGFAEEAYNELPCAHQVAQRFATDYHEMLVTADVAGMLPRLIWQYDEPFADKSAVPTCYVAHMASRHVTVAPICINPGGAVPSTAMPRPWRH
jgi:asparagine synthase (glutamine-hydrolysing)